MIGNIDRRLTNQSTPKVVGKRVVVFDQYDDGLCIIRKETFKPCEPTITCLQDICYPGTEAKQELFIAELVRNGVVDELTMQWLYGEVSLKCCYWYISSDSVKLARPGVDWTDVYRAFSGTFRLPKIKHARNLQKRNNVTPEYRKKLKKWESIFKESFSLNR